MRDGDCIDVLPEGFSAKSRVYEYGGAPYTLLPGVRVIFSNFSDKFVYILDVDEGTVSTLLESNTLRYADFHAHPGDEPWVLAVEEDHEHDMPEQVKNYIVAIHTATGQVKRIVQGADFYMFPTFSLDGKKISWVEWNFPGMPWAGVSLYWATWSNGAIDPQTIEHVAGTETSTVTEPRWGPDGCLYYAEEQTDFYQLFRRHPDGGDATSIRLPGLEKTEIGSAKMACGR